MKSKDIKNWNYELLYRQIAVLDDFTDILTKAITQGVCILCGGFKVFNNGLCNGCTQQLEGNDATISDFIINTVKTERPIKIYVPNNFQIEIIRTLR